MRAPLAPGALAPSSAGAPSMRAGMPHTGPLLTGTAEMACGSTSGRTHNQSHIPRWQRDGDRHRMGKQPQHQMLVGTCSCRRNTISNSDLHVAGRKGNPQEASSQPTCFCYRCSVSEALQSSAADPSLAQPKWLHAAKAAAQRGAWSVAVPADTESPC